MDDHSELRALALQHATHDCRGNHSAEEVLARAQAYLAFLNPMVSGQLSQQTAYQGEVARGQFAAVHANAANPYYR